MKKVKRVIAGVFIAMILAVAFLMITPLLFRDKFAAIVKETASESLRTDLSFTGMDVSFIRHFPHLTVTLSGLVLKSSVPFSDDTLVSAAEASLGVDLYSLISGPAVITRMYIDRGRVNILYDDDGNPNYDVYRADTVTAGSDSGSPGGSALRIEQINFSNSVFTYSDPSIPLSINARGINYRGRTDLADAILKLSSRVSVDSLDIVYDRIPVIPSKPLEADLETTVDLNSLTMKLEKNDLRIKDIPFEFKGELGFRKNGYELFIAFFSMYGEEYLSGSLWLKSGDSLWISAKTDLNITIENWTRGLAVKDSDLRGHFALKLHAEGDLVAGNDPGGTFQQATFLSIPDYQLTARLENGYFRYRDLPYALEGISFDFASSASGHDIKTASFSLENLRASFLENTISGFIRIKDMDKFPVEAGISARIDLGELTEAIPFDSLSLKGLLELNLQVEGTYDPSEKRFPETTITLDLSEGEIATKYSPLPIRNISVNALITNKTGDISGTGIRLDPLSFTFGGNPFIFRGEFSDPLNLTYSIESNGSVDLAGIYHLFSEEGMELSGYLSADVRLKGNKQDAVSGNLSRLQNSGTLVLREIALKSEYLPLPLILNSGIFRFQDDRVWFDEFDCRYGSSDITMNGHLSNVVQYLLTDDQPLKGNFTLRSGLLVVDEFMAPTEPVSSGLEADSLPEGVIVIPENLEIGFNTGIKKIRFRDLDITGFSGSAGTVNGLLALKSVNFTVAGCRVGMDAVYGSTATDRAYFDFHLTARDFNVRKMYNEVDLFRNLCPSAGKCEGIMSLDYTLKGRLGAGMYPIYHSLEGGGTLTLEEVKVKGLKLLNAMGRNLEKEEIKNPGLTRVELNTTIKNNVITLERTRMKMAGFRFRVEGETSFSGQINLKTRLGLPPLGIVGIPIRILGTSDNPRFRYGRGTSDEDIEVTEYTEELSPEMLSLIREAKEE